MSPATNSDLLIIDDRTGGDLGSRLGTKWRTVSDQVMGGVSTGTLTAEVVAGRTCLRLRGAVSLANNGGFLQAGLDLATEGFFDAGGFAGVELDVYGNGERYNVHLRTADTVRVWQSFRAGFDALPRWTTLRLPFADFRPHRTEARLDLCRLRRIGVVAIGREFIADLCIARLAFYR